jgi:hypothetical protein
VVTTRFKVETPIRRFGSGVFITPVLHDDEVLASGNKSAWKVVAVRRTSAYRPYGHPSAPTSAEARSAEAQFVRYTRLVSVEVDERSKQPS